jgi:hypothetical protein
MTAAESGLGAYLRYSTTMANSCQDGVNSIDTTIGALETQDWSGEPIEALGRAKEALATAGSALEDAHNAFQRALAVTDAYAANNHAGTKESVLDHAPVPETGPSTSGHDPERTGFAGQLDPTPALGNPGMDATEPDSTEPTVTYTTPEIPFDDFDDHRPGKGLDSIQDTVNDLLETYLATQVDPITTPTGIRFEVTGPRRNIEYVADLYGETLPSAAAAPEPAPGAAPEPEPAAALPQPEPSPAPVPVPEPPAVPQPPAPVTGQMSDKPLLENSWGGFTDSPVSYHEDGPIGYAINSMGAEARLDVDGEPLANVLGVIATDVVRGRRTAQQGVDDLKVLHDRLPPSGSARFYLDRALQDMDAPAGPAPEVPDGTPQPLRELVTALHAVPLVRNDRSKELDPLLAIVDDFAAGRAGGGRMVEEVRRLRNKRHESLGDAGKFEIDRAVEAAVTALDAMPREALTPRTTS